MDFFGTGYLGIFWGGFCDSTSRQNSSNSAVLMPRSEKAMARSRKLGSVRLAVGGREETRGRGKREEEEREEEGGLGLGDETKGRGKRECEEREEEGGLGLGDETKGRGKRE